MAFSNESIAGLKQEFSTALTKNNITIDADKQDTLLQYLDMMLKWNKTYNLTAITAPREMLHLHLIDSLIIAPYVKGARCLDLGTGAGLPGIPLAITHPDQHWSLVDKNNKKTRFLTQVIADLKLKNAQAVHLRGEEFHPTQGFDSILSRAFGTLRLFVETTGHLLNPNGEFIAMKGRYPEEELADLPDKVRVQSVTRIDINGMDIERHIVCLKFN